MWGRAQPPVRLGAALEGRHGARRATTSVFRLLWTPLSLQPPSTPAFAFVHVAARLPSASLGRLRAVLDSDDELIEVSDWAGLHHALRSQPIDLMVIDPRVAEHEPSEYDEGEPSPVLTREDWYARIRSPSWSRESWHGGGQTAPCTDGCQ